ncbi:hypothetical protein V2J09_005552 [Rumex salicifolius]
MGKCGLSKKKLYAMEEDCNALIADCIVISCCCECFILRVVIFLLVDLPCKVARKTRKYAIKKLGRHSRKRKREAERSAGLLEAQYCASGDGSFRLIQVELEIDESSFSEEICMEEVDRVLEELSSMGEFAFGSFWGRCNSSSGISVNERELFASTHGYVH